MGRVKGRYVGDEEGAGRGELDEDELRRAVRTADFSWTSPLPSS